MAQKITFTFNSNAVVGDLTANFKFNNGINYFNEDIIFTSFTGTASNRVLSGSSTTEFASNFKDILIGLMHPNGSIPFYNKVTQLGNIVEVITGSTITTDIFLLNDISTEIGSIGSLISYTKVIYTSSSLLVSWSGASDDHGISGYELTYKVNSGDFWLGPVFVETTLTGGIAELPVIGSINRDYTIRIRTKDDAGQYSDYKTISNSVGYRRSETSVILGDACGLDTSIPIYLEGPLPSSGDTLAYIDVDKIYTFNGLSQYWSITDLENNKYSVRIDANGVIDSTTSCGSLPSMSYRTSNKVSLSSTMCKAICNVTIYYYDDLLAVGTTLYTNLTGTPFTYTSTTNDYYLIDNLYVCKINRTNGEVMDVRFRSSYCSTSGGGGCCLAKGTEVLLSNDDVKNIEDVVIGDIVKSYDFEKKVVSESIVIKTFNPLKDDLVKIILSNNTYIDCTTSHPLWSVTKNNWVSINPEITKKFMGIDADVLDINDVLLDIDSNHLVILEINSIDTSLVTTYDISVEPFNNYYANNILVHNKISAVIT